jgi:hypothetical protein
MRIVVGRTDDTPRHGSTADGDEDARTERRQLQILWNAVRERA